MTIVTPAPAVPGFDTGHVFTRRGRALPVRVLEVSGGANLGHVLIFGEPAEDCLVRIHSRCLYGEALGSDDCDCGPELDKALDLIMAAGAGVLVYLEQEGRGMGLIAKAAGYHYSEQFGTDTFASYQGLGFPEDHRSYDDAALSLCTLGLNRIQLLTNNPEKAKAVRRFGIQVTTVPLATAPLSERASAYLEAKRLRRKHMIPDGSVPWAVELR